MLMPAVNYLRVVGYEHDAAKTVERNEGLSKGHIKYQMKSKK